MRGAKRVIFIVGTTLTAIPAIAGAFVGVVACAVVIAVAVVLCAVLSLVIAICCVPLIVWCACFEISNFEPHKKPVANRDAVTELN